MNYINAQEKCILYFNRISESCNFIEKQFIRIPYRDKNLWCTFTDTVSSCFLIDGFLWPTFYSQSHQYISYDSFISSREILLILVVTLLLHFSSALRIFDRMFSLSVIYDRKMFDFHENKNVCISTQTLKRVNKIS